MHPEQRKREVEEECCDCHQKFFSQFQYDNHKCKDKFVCSLGKKRFSFKQSLTRHNCEYNRIAVKCFVCKASFTPYSLVKHIKRFHSKEKEEFKTSCFDNKAILDMVTDVGISDNKLLKILR